MNPYQRPDLDSVSLLLGGDQPPVTEPEEAAEQVVAYLRQWAEAMVWPGRPCLMLSGGIDSVLLAAVLAPLEPVCFTVAEPNSRDSFQSTVATEALGLDHTVVSPAELLPLVGPVSEALGTAELWSLTAALPHRAAVEFFEGRGLFGPVVTGNGADIAFLGGRPRGQGLVAEARFHRGVAYFANPMEDFYERFLGNRVHRLSEPYITKNLWALAGRLTEEALMVDRHGVTYDKAPLRMAAETLGVPVEAAWTVKEPLQKSSGMIRAVVG